MATMDSLTSTKDPTSDLEAAELAESELTDEELDVIVGGLERVWQYEPLPESVDEA